MVHLHILKCVFTQNVMVHTAFVLESRSWTADAMCSMRFGVQLISFGGCRRTAEDCSSWAQVLSVGGVSVGYPGTATMLTGMRGPKLTAVEVDRDAYIDCC